MIRIIAIIAFSATCLMACNDKADDSGTSAKEVSNSETVEVARREDEGVLFREGKGLEIPEVTKKALAMKVAEVTEGDIEASLSRAAQIYQSSSNIQLVSSGGRTPVTLASLTLSSEEAKGIRKGDQAKVEDRATAKVVGLHQAALSATGEVEVLLEIYGTNQGYKVGDTVNVSFASNERKSTTLIPRSALLETVNGTFVYVPNGKYFFRTAVQAGAKNREWVEILDGLYPGDEVVQEPVQSLWLAELQAIKGGVGCADGH